MVRPIDIKQKQARINALIKLIDEHPEAIQLNVRKLCHTAKMSINDYQILYRVWSDIKQDVKFKRVAFK